MFKKTGESPVEHIMEMCKACNKGMVYVKTGKCANDECPTNQPAKQLEPAKTELN